MLYMHQVRLYKILIVATNICSPSKKIEEYSGFWRIQAFTPTLFLAMCLQPCICSLVQSYFMRIEMLFDSRNDDPICRICVGTTVVWDTIGVFVFVDNTPRQLGAEERLSVSLRNVEFCLNVLFKTIMMDRVLVSVLFWVLRPLNLCLNSYLELLLLGICLRIINVLSKKCHFPFCLNMEVYCGWWNYRIISN